LDVFRACFGQVEGSISALGEFTQVIWLNVRSRLQLAGLDCGASKVIGIEKEAKYLRTAKKRVGAG
jgi:hypothetical protein